MTIAMLAKGQSIKKSVSPGELQGLQYGLMAIRAPCSIQHYGLGTDLRSLAASSISTPNPYDDLQAKPRKSATWRTREGARQLYSMAVVRPAAPGREDPVPSNGVARGGGPRPHPGCITATSSSTCTAFMPAARGPSMSARGVSPTNSTRPASTCNPSSTAA